MGFVSGFVLQQPHLAGELMYGIPRETRCPRKDPLLRDFHIAEMCFVSWQLHQDAATVVVVDDLLLLQLAAASNPSVVTKELTLMPVPVCLSWYAHTAISGSVSKSE